MRSSPGRASRPRPAHEAMAVAVPQLRSRPAPTPVPSGSPRRRASMRAIGEHDRRVAQGSTCEACARRPFHVRPTRWPAATVSPSAGMWQTPTSAWPSISRAINTAKQRHAADEVLVPSMGSTIPRNADAAFVGAVPSRPRCDPGSVWQWPAGSAARRLGSARVTARRRPELDVPHGLVVARSLRAPRRARTCSAKAEILLQRRVIWVG